MTETTTFNSRLQPITITAGTLLTLDYDYGGTANNRAGVNNNGNVLGQTITRGGQHWTQAFGYDPVDRLTCANEVTGLTALLPCETGTPPGWKQIYSYDPAGNRAVGSSFTQILSIATPQTPTVAWQYSSSSNRLVKRSDGATPMPDDAYDASGNLAHHPDMGKFSYDAENRLSCANAVPGATACGTPTAGDAATTTYAYDGDGRRVSKTTGAGTTVYVYDALGELAAEYPATAPTVLGTQYLTADALGSTRLVTDVNGAVLRCSDYLPFGEELGSGTVANGRTSSCFTAPEPTAENKFTGKERDAESGLDYFGARYMSSAQGRFTTPDPLLNSGRPDDPQTWNRYGYALNNPLTITDPTGLYNLINNCAGDDANCNKQFSQDAKQLRDGLAALTKAVNGLKAGDQKTALQGALAAIGTEDDRNNVGVQFAPLGGNAAGQTDINVGAAGAITGYTVTFDRNKTRGMFDQAIDAAHEGQHVEDLGDSRFADNATTLSPFSAEYRGYRTSAYAASALGQNLSYGKNGQYPIWNGSWAAVDRNLTNYITTFRDKQGQPDHPETVPHDPWGQKQ